MRTTVGVTTILGAVVVVAAVIGAVVRVSGDQVTVSSSAAGFEGLTSGTQYEYGPAIVLHGASATYYQFYCSPGDGVTQWDWIRMTTSADGFSWTSPVVVLKPETSNDAWDTNSVCDPTVVEYHGVYLMYVSCINQVNPPDGYKSNRICLAASDSITGPYYKYLTAPVLEDLTCPDSEYCVGQPSAVVSPNGTLLLYYSNVQNSMGGPNAGHIHVAASNDGVSFTKITQEPYPCLSQRDVDVKYDRESGLYFMIQGDVGSTLITWATSSDGISFTPYNESHSIVTNPSLPSGGDNNNPGLAGLPDGTLGSGYTWGAYGSSYEPITWGNWHLYRSNIVLQPGLSDCSQCAENSCDWACTKTLGKLSYGTCAYPGSTDQTKCCSCSTIPTESNCDACAPTGCVSACRGSGYTMGICGRPGSTDPSNCCTCYY
ncbi:hypothetical protein Pelo_4641 [Pelomyxa schiedti]|nr:hypothetical protein Pelo_4641 [Pelomyxa schiedti]